MAMDGMNPFGNNSSAYSIWLIVLTFYNLPPWLTIKASFLILGAIIPGELLFFYFFYINLSQKII